MMGQISHWLWKLWIGMRLRCPNCERGKMFSGLFRMEPVCSHCGARYERAQGESIGGTLINLVAAEMLSMGGFIITQVLFSPPMLFQLVFWVSFNLIFIVLFYRHARSMWVSVAYLTGGVYPDNAPPKPGSQL